MRPMPPPMLEPALLSLEDSSKNSCAKIGTEMRKRNHATSHKTAQFSVHSLLSYPPGEIALRLPELDTALVLVVRPDHLQTSFNSHRSSCINLKTFRILS